MVSGGLAGQISWISVYPFDVIKTKMQVESKRHLSMRAVVKAGFRQEGWRFFFKGLGMTLIGTFLYSGIVLPT
jgi:solute carrier family 25 (mitochondrial carnitine/acylcarnitine transporter), member 20/29